MKLNDYLKGKTFTARRCGSDLSGCSSNSQVFGTTRSMNSDSYYTHYADGEGTPVEELQAYHDGTRRGCAIYYPTLPGWGEGDTYIGKAFQIYELMTDDGGVMMLGSRSDCLQLRSDMRQHMPEWQLRPHKLIDFSGLIEQGALRQVNGRMERHGYYDVRPAKMEYKKSFGFNNKLSDLSLDAPNIPTHVHGFRKELGAGAVYRIRNASYNLRNTQLSMFSDKHNAGDWAMPLGFSLANTGMVPWWGEFQVRGLDVPEPEDIMAGAVECIRTSGMKRQNGLTVIAGNPISFQHANSVRIVTAFAEHSGWANPMNTTVPFIKDSAGDKLYYRIAPFIWESPGHSYHPIYSVFFSYRPITWRKVGRK